MRHFVVVGILVIVMAVLTYVGLDSAGLMPVEASAQSVSIDWLWNWQIVAISFLFALIVVPMAYSMVMFRRKKGDTTDAEHMEGNTTLEITWTVIPLFIVLTFAYMGAYSLGETRRVDPNAMVIKVRAQQFTAWASEQETIMLSSQTPESLGKILTVKNGCVGCHSIDGTELTAPTWFGLYGSVVPLADGTTVVADDAYLAESILNSTAKLVEGFSPTTMPAYTLTDVEVANLIAYIKTLK